jgi:hypothetical protein
LTCCERKEVITTGITNFKIENHVKVIHQEQISFTLSRKSGYANTLEDE